jgi:hypothetical protein
VIVVNGGGVNKYAILLSLFAQTNAKTSTKITTQP